MPNPTAETIAAGVSDGRSSLLSKTLSLLLAGFAACAATAHVWHA